MDYLEEALGIATYNHQDSGIPNTRLRWSSWIMAHGQLHEIQIFYELSGQFAHKLHYFKDETIASNIQCVDFPTLKHYDNMGRTSWHALPKENK
jgi:hypothetical protein